MIIVLYQFGRTQVANLVQKEDVDCHAPDSISQKANRGNAIRGLDDNSGSVESLAREARMSESCLPLNMLNSFFRAKTPLGTFPVADGQSSWTLLRAKIRPLSSKVAGSRGYRFSKFLSVSCHFKARDGLAPRNIDASELRGEASNHTGPHIAFTVTLQSDVWDPKS